MLLSLPLPITDVLSGRDLTCKDNLSRHKYEEYYLRFQHAIYKPWEQFWFITASKGRIGPIKLTDEWVLGVVKTPN